MFNNKICWLTNVGLSYKTVYFHNNINNVPVRQFSFWSLLHRTILAVCRGFFDWASFFFGLVWLQFVWVHVSSLKKMMAKEMFKTITASINCWRENHSWNLERLAYRKKTQLIVGQISLIFTRDTFKEWPLLIITLTHF